MGGPKNVGRQEQLSQDRQGYAYMESRQLWIFLDLLLKQHQPLAAQHLNDLVPAPIQPTKIGPKEHAQHQLDPDEIEKAV